MTDKELEYTFKRIELAEQNYKNALIKLAEHSPDTKAFNIQEACVDILKEELLVEINKFRNQK